MAEAGAEIRLGGIVQGVGFRPFVYRLALRLGLRGTVRNAGDAVVVVAVGPAAALDAFAHGVREEAPPLARIEAFTRRVLTAQELARWQGEVGFRIAESGAGTVSVGVVPDVATCPACRAEIADSRARRFRYAFTNCTDCGPRFSIVTALPYDRPATTMAGFSLCPACAAEYADPADRRFHAQPIACPTCGPRVWLERVDDRGGMGVSVDGDVPPPNPPPQAGEGFRGGARFGFSRGGAAMVSAPPYPDGASPSPACGGGGLGWGPAGAGGEHSEGAVAPPAGEDRPSACSASPRTAVGTCEGGLPASSGAGAVIDGGLPPPNPPPQAGEGFRGGVRVGSGRSGTAVVSAPPSPDGASPSPACGGGPGRGPAGVGGEHSEGAIAPPEGEDRPSACRASLRTAVGTCDGGLPASSAMVPAVDGDVPPPNPPPQAGEGFRGGARFGFSRGGEAVLSAPPSPDGASPSPACGGGLGWGPAGAAGEHSERAFAPPAAEDVRVGAEEAIDAAAALLRAGRIVAVKGIGGFHIACDATDAAAVASLRQRKRRPSKPLAVMADRAQAELLCEIGPAEAAALEAPSAPIVLLPLRDGHGLAPEIAPGQRQVGLMLPYTPLHHLLLEAVGRPLVMTSGNSSGVPQVIANEQARAALGDIVDGFLMHDRPIARRLDDSVVRLAAGAPRVLRRGRGLAPLPLSLPADFASAPPVLALGAELKSAICLTHGAKALLSHHLGDLDEPGTVDAFEATLADYSAMFAHAPARVAVDAHSGYHATRFGTAWAARHGLTLEAVQHHHAHMAAAMAEAGWRRADGPVVAILLDGLGLGDDGTLWGAEILVGDYFSTRRVACLAPIALMGGDQASREPWRVLLAHLDQALGRPVVDGDPLLAALFAGKPVATLRAMADKGLNAPRASSAGRLFDAVAALLGLAPARLSHEGEAAMALEAVAEAGAAPYPFAATEQDGFWDLDPAPLWRALRADQAAGRPLAAMAGAFHAGLAAAFADTAARIARREGIGAVALGGGVFQNRLLLEAVVARLADAGLRPLVPANVPANDGGLALGQAVVVAARCM